MSLRETTRIDLRQRDRRPISFLTRLSTADAIAEISPQRQRTALFGPTKETRRWKPMRRVSEGDLTRSILLLMIADLMPIL
jgi:hypothetical protein